MSAGILEQVERSRALRDVPLVQELVAEVKAKRNLALDMLTKNKDLLDRAMRAEAEVERLRSEMDTYGDDFVCQMKAKDARIAELEEAIRCKSVG